MCSLFAVQDSFRAPPQSWMTKAGELWIHKKADATKNSPECGLAGTQRSQQTHERPCRWQSPRMSVLAPQPRTQFCHGNRGFYLVPDKEIPKKSLAHQERRSAEGMSQFSGVLIYRTMLVNWFCAQPASTAVHERNDNNDSICVFRPAEQ